jgi:hypothetical protein
MPKSLFGKGLRRRKTAHRENRGPRTKHNPSPESVGRQGLSSKTYISFIQLLTTVVRCGMLCGGTGRRIRDKRIRHGLNTYQTRIASVFNPCFISGPFRVSCDSCISWFDAPPFAQPPKNRTTERRTAAPESPLVSKLSHLFPRC